MTGKAKYLQAIYDQEGEHQLEAVTVKDLHAQKGNYLNKKIQINGWVRTVRSSKTFGFIELNDGTFFSNLQVVYDEKLTNFQEISKLITG